jgi:hypothetical protein
VIQPEAVANDLHRVAEPLVRRHNGGHQPSPSPPRSTADHPSHRRPHRVDSAGSPTSAHPAGGQLSGWPSRSMGGVGRPGGGRQPADLPRDYHCERLVTLIQRKRNYH